MRMLYAMAQPCSVLLGEKGVFRPVAILLGSGNAMRPGPRTQSASPIGWLALLAQAHCAGTLARRSINRVTTLILVSAAPTWWYGSPGRKGEFHDHASRDSFSRDRKE